MSHLPNLISLRFRALRLQVNYLFNSLVAENMITAANSLFKPESSQEAEQLVEVYIRVSPSAKNLPEQSLSLSQFLTLACNGA